MESLEEIYLSHNGITRIEGLEHNVNNFSFSNRKKKILTPTDQMHARVCVQSSLT